MGALQGDIQKGAGLASTATNLRQQLYERAQRNKALMQEMESLEQRYKLEVEKLRKENARKITETVDEKKRARTLESEFEESKRDSEELRLRNHKLETDLEQSQKNLQ